MVSPSTTLCFLFFKKASTHLIVFSSSPSALSFTRSPACETKSKALEKSNKMRSTRKPRLSDSVIISKVSSKLVTHDLNFTKPCWLLEMRLLSIICLTINSFIVFSIILHGMDVSDMGIVWRISFLSFLIDRTYIYSFPKIWNHWCVKRHYVNFW